MVQSNEHKVKFDNEMRQILEEPEERGEIFTEDDRKTSRKLQ